MQDSPNSVPVYNVDTLAKKAGVTRRTIHYYVQRGLLPRPHGGGRGFYYTEAHLQRLKLIQKWREQGVPLENMKEFLSGASSRPIPSPAQPTFSERSPITHWTRLTVDSGIELSFKSGCLTQEDQDAIRKFIVARVKK
jgi:DNA-binding transcriptional MerR regulator